MYRMYKAGSREDSGSSHLSVGASWFSCYDKEIHRTGYTSPTSHNPHQYTQIAPRDEGWTSNNQNGLTQHTWQKFITFLTAPSCVSAGASTIEANSFVYSDKKRLIHKISYTKLESRNITVRRKDTLFCVWSTVEQHTIHLKLIHDKGNSHEHIERLIISIRWISTHN